MAAPASAAARTPLPAFASGLRPREPAPWPPTTPNTVRLWFDEDLSPTLVQVAHELGFEGTCNRDRGVLGISDAALPLGNPAANTSGVSVTNNTTNLAPSTPSSP